MVAYGYGSVPDRAFVAFDRELDDGAWKDISTSGYVQNALETIAGCGGGVRG